MARPKKKVLTPEEQIENAIGMIVVDSEYRTAASMQTEDNLAYVTASLEYGRGGLS